MTFAIRSFILLAAVIFTAVPSAAQAWRNQRTGAPGDLVAVYFTSSNEGWIAGDNGHLAHTSDGGRTWAKRPIGTTENINEIYFRNDDNGYLVAGKKVFITRDGGDTWNETVLYRPTDFKNAVPEFLSIRFADKRRGLVIGSLLNSRNEVVDSLVMRSDDGGETWTRVIVPSKLELFDLDFNGSSQAWIVGDGGLILATRDSGVTWTKQNSGVTRALFNVDFRDDEDGYAVGGGGTILKTENGGDTWTRVITPYKETFMRVDFADDKNGWIVGHKGTVLRSSDRGSSWIKQDSGTTQDLYGLFMSKKYGWAVGASGALIEYKK